MNRAFTDLAVVAFSGSGCPIPLAMFYRVSRSRHLTTIPSFFGDLARLMGIGKVSAMPGSSWSAESLTPPTDPLSTPFLGRSQGVRLHLASRHLRLPGPQPHGPGVEEGFGAAGRGHRQQQAQQFPQPQQAA